MSKPAILDDDSLLNGTDHLISDQEFEAMTKYIYDNFGIVLGPTKKSMVVGRLLGALRRDKIPSFTAYLQAVQNDSSGRMKAELGNRISTNHTFFNRDENLFQYYRDVALPNVIQSIVEKGGQKDIRLWCAGCSTGEEPYTLTMMLMDALGGEYKAWSAGMLATDISTKVLAHAQAAVYELEAVRALPKELVKRYFRRVDAGHVRVISPLQREVVFKRFNLLDIFPFKRPFHMIFCRNVMIYFDNETKKTLLEKIGNHLEPEGYLFVGASESVPPELDYFEKIQAGIYRKK